MTTNGVSRGAIRVIAAVMATIIVAGMISIPAWTAKRVIAHDIAIAEMQANRFTSADGLRFAEEQKRIWSEISKIRTTAATVPKVIPPTWFRDEVLTLGQDIREMRKSLAELERKVDRIETKLGHLNDPE